MGKGWISGGAGIPQTLVYAKVRAHFTTFPPVAKSRNLALEAPSPDLVAFNKISIENDRFGEGGQKPESGPGGAEPGFYRFSIRF